MNFARLCDAQNCARAMALAVAFLVGACKVQESAKVEIRYLAPQFNFEDTALRSSVVFTLAGDCYNNGEAGDVLFTGDFVESPLEVPCEEGSYSVDVTLSGAEGKKQITATYFRYDFSWEVEFDSTAPVHLTGISPPSQSILYDNSSFSSPDSVDLVIPCESSGSDVALSGDFVGASRIVSCDSDDFARTTVTLSNGTYTDGQGPNLISIAQSDDVGNASSEVLRLYKPLVFYVDPVFGDDTAGEPGNELAPFQTLAEAFVNTTQTTNDIEDYMAVHGLLAQATSGDEEALVILKLEAGTYSGATLAGDWDARIHVHGRYSDPTLTRFGDILATGSNAADATADGVADVECQTLPTDGFNVTIQSNLMVMFGEITTTGGRWTNVSGGDCTSYVNGDSGSIKLVNVYLDGDFGGVNLDVDVDARSGDAGLVAAALGSPGNIEVVSSWIVSSNTLSASSSETLSSTAPPNGGTVQILNSRVGAVQSWGGASPIEGSDGGALTLTESYAGDLNASGADASTQGGNGGAISVLSNSRAANLSSNGGNGTSGGTAALILVSGNSVVGDISAVGGTGVIGGTVNVLGDSITNDIDVTGLSGGAVNLVSSSAGNIVAEGTLGVGGNVSLSENSSANLIDVDAVAGTFVGGSVTLNESTAVTIHARGGDVDGAGNTNGNGGTVSLVGSSPLVVDVDISAGSGTGDGVCVAGTVDNPALISGTLTDNPNDPYP